MPPVLLAFVFHFGGKVGFFHYCISKMGFEVIYCVYLNADGSQICDEQQGLWVGLICGLFVQALLLVTIILCTNWVKEVSTLNEFIFNLNDFFLSTALANVCIAMYVR